MVKPEEVFGYLTTSPNTDVKAIRNPSGVPDQLLLERGTVPVFTIRNPRLQVPSVYRLSLSVLPGDPVRAETLASLTGRWTRLFYDWYLANGVRAIIVDADDYMSSETFVRHLCEVAGLNPAEALIKWDETKYDQTNRTERNHAAIRLRKVPWPIMC